MSKKRILIVEDEPIMSKMIAMELQHAGFETMIAEDGEQGLKRSQEQNPDLIISDVLMPRKDGFQMYKELKESGATKDIPVLILTARGKMEDSFRVIGVDEFVAKPFDSEELLEKVKKLLLRTGGGSDSPDDSVKAETPAAKASIIINGGSADAVAAIEGKLKELGQEVSVYTGAADTIRQAAIKMPKVLVFEIPMDDMPPADFIGSTRKLPGGDQVILLAYSFFKTAGGASEDPHEHAMRVDAALEACQDAGAMEYLGRCDDRGFDEKLQQTLK